MKTQRHESIQNFLIKCIKNNIVDNYFPVVGSIKCEKCNNTSYTYHEQLIEFKVI